MDFSIDTLAWICAGIGLSAACGFRVFVPLLAAGFAARMGWLSLSDGFEWACSDSALVVFSVATIVEIGAYYIPWLDNFLDAIATPLSVVAGIVVSASMIRDVDPAVQWSLATVAGGGTAGTIKLGMSGLRLGSSFLTGGLANPVVSTVEWIGSLLMAILAFALPIVALVIAATLVVVLARFGWRVIRWRLRQRGKDMNHSSGPRREFRH